MIELAAASPRGYCDGMSDETYIAGLRAERDRVSALLAPLEDGRLVSGSSPEANDARIAFFQRQIADIDAIIAREESDDH